VTVLASHDADQARRHAVQLPFGDDPAATAFALIARWTGITITEPSFVGTKPTFL
jgi:hypothetical protein